MATIPVNGYGEHHEAREVQDNALKLLRVIVADSQAIFRAGLRKIFAIEDDIRVVGQAEHFDHGSRSKPKPCGHGFRVAPPDAKPAAGRSHLEAA